MAGDSICSVREVFRLRVGDVVDLGPDPDGEARITALVVRVTACAANVQPITKSGKQCGHQFRISPNSEVPILNRGVPVVRFVDVSATTTLPPQQNAATPLHRRDLPHFPRRRLLCKPEPEAPTHLPQLWDDPTQWL